MKDLLQEGEVLDYRIEISGPDLRISRKVSLDIANVILLFILGDHQEEISREVEKFLTAHPDFQRRLENDFQSTADSKKASSENTVSYKNLRNVASHASQFAESKLIREVLQETGGNKSHAAKILQVSYKTLLTKIKEYNLEEE